MSDDWRLRIDLHEDGPAHTLTERLNAAGLEHRLEEAFHDRVIVSRDGAEVFCYAGTRGQAERAEELIRSLAAEHDWQVETELRRWHPTAEDWQDPDTPLPEDDRDRAAERAELMSRERTEAETRGYPEFEVRVQCPSRRDASRFADALREQGLASVHRARYLLVGASDEDSANRLAEQLRQQAPAGSTITTQGTGRAVLDEQPANPFAVLGGMGQ